MRRDRRRRVAPRPDPQFQAVRYARVSGVLQHALSVNGRVAGRSRVCLLPEWVGWNLVAGHDAALVDVSSARAVTVDPVVLIGRPWIMTCLRRS